jgi:hypothetical protein
VVEVQMKEREMRERRSALLLASEKRPLREAQMVARAIRGAQGATSAREARLVRSAIRDVRGGKYDFDDISTFIR